MRMLHEWVKKTEVADRRCAGAPTDGAAKLKTLERESGGIRNSGRPMRSLLSTIMAGHTGHLPICKVLPIAPSTDHAHIAKRIDTGKLSARAQRDAVLKREVRRGFEEKFRVHGVQRRKRTAPVAHPSMLSRAPYIS